MASSAFAAYHQWLPSSVQLQPQGTIMLLPSSVVSHRAITCYCPPVIAHLWGYYRALWHIIIAQLVPLIVWLQGLHKVLTPSIKTPI